MAGLGAIARKLFGTPNDRRLKTFAPKVQAINALEPEVAALFCLVQNVGTHRSGRM